MAKLSVILPSRDEKYLVPTIHDIFRNARGEIEVIAVIDSDKWPADWKAVSDQYPNLHTIHHGTSLGMRRAINSGFNSAMSRGSRFIAKFDAHCSFGEGFDEILKAECDKDWIVVPRRKRLNPETWELTDTNKPDVDYHYLSFPDDPKDFGGPGLNGKIWLQRAVERKDILLDDEMSSQGSGWLMQADYFTRLELMDEASYGKFWNEFQELGLKCWLSGGQVKVNKKTWYSHWHKGKAGRGYRLEESALQQGATFTKNWIWNEAWPRQALPFKWLINHFWPVPGWPENWEEVLYAERKPMAVPVLRNHIADKYNVPRYAEGGLDIQPVPDFVGGLVIHNAYYGIGDSPDKHVDVTQHLQSLVKDDSLDIVVSNSTLTPGQNPFRGKKKTLRVRYSINGGEDAVRLVPEKDWLIVGPVRESVKQTGIPYVYPEPNPASIEAVAARRESGIALTPAAKGPPMTAVQLNDYLIRRFQISPQRLRGPMPIELRDFHRNDLAQLFAELGFKRGAEIGVAEGHYSEILLKANPDLELLLVDPWHHYSDNPQGKSKEKHEFAFNETRRRTEPFKDRVKILPFTSMEALHVRDFEIPDRSLDIVYIDGHHSYPYVMTDLIEWSKKVRSGGIVAGDDAFKLDEKRWGAGPMEAIFDYTRAMRISPWFLCDAPRSVDFFWVKL